MFRILICTGKLIVRPGVRKGKPLGVAKGLYNLSTPLEGKGISRERQERRAAAELRGFSYLASKNHCTAMVTGAPGIQAELIWSVAAPVPVPEGTRKFTW